MTNEPNKTMVSRQEIYEAIAASKAQLDRLRLLDMDLEMYGENSEEVLEARHQLFETAEVCYAALRRFDEALKATEES